MASRAGDDPGRRALPVLVRPLAIALASLFTQAGCAATSPLLVDPRLPLPGQVRLQGGLAAHAYVGDTGTRLAQARQALAAGEWRSADGAAALLMAAAPGLAPFARVSVPLGVAVEGSVRYGGREVALGARVRLFDRKTAWASSQLVVAGLELRGIVQDGIDDRLAAPLRMIDIWGYGATLPIVYAWQSDEGLLHAYAGAQLGVDYVAGTSDWNNMRERWGALRLWGGGVLGLGVGFRRVRATVELGLQREWVEGTVADRSVRIGTWALAPAMGLSLTL